MPTRIRRQNKATSAENLLPQCDQNQNVKQLPRGFSVLTPRDAKPVAPWDWRAARRAKSDVVPSEVKVVPNGVAIVALLPNPNGTDAGHEQITIGNSTGEIVKLDGWKLIDKAGNLYLLSGRVEAGKSLVVTMTEATMPLNNNGDTVALIGPDGVGRSRVSYLGSQARSGAVIRIGQ